MTTTAADTKSADSKPAVKAARRWAPRMWIGMTLGPWLGLLARNRFQVAPRYWYKAAAITLAATVNTLWWALEVALLGLFVRRTKVDPRPLIILGHWRSGTTYLHELLGLDAQFASPTTYQCLSPSNFLVTHWWATRLFFWLMPKKRPMDDMATGWERPQEDEFALCNLGERSPYLTVAFPNHRSVFQEYLTLDVPQADVERWKRMLFHFLQRVTFASPKRLIIKSPPHTARVRVLLEMFPEARFVYLVRDPNALYSSTMHLWRRLYETHGLQVPDYQGIEEHVLSTFVTIYERFERDRGLIPPGRLYELRYEDLVADPVGRTREIYEQLELGDFARVRPAIEQYVASNADYQTNRFALSDEERRTIAERWAEYIERHGYESVASS